MINKKTYSKKILYRSSELIKALGISQTTLWRWQKNGDFPRPIKLGPRIIAWKFEEINNWIEKNKGHKMKKNYKELISGLAKKLTKEEKEKPLELYSIEFPNPVLYGRLQSLTLNYLSAPYFQKYTDLDSIWIVSEAYEVFHKKRDFSPSNRKCLKEIKKATKRDLKALIDSDLNAPR